MRMDNANGLPTNPPEGAIFARGKIMPNLEELFFGNAGGTIALMVLKTALEWYNACR